MELKTHMLEYRISASRIPTLDIPSPQIYNATIYAKNTVSARSKMSKILSKQFKLKSTKTVILNMEEVNEDNDEMKIKNYGITYLFKTKGKYINMYKEFRALSRCDAVSMLFHDMAGRHNASSDNIFVVEIKELAIEDLKRNDVIQFTGEVKFPYFRKNVNSDETFVSEKIRYYD